MLNIAKTNGSVAAGKDYESPRLTKHLWVEWKEANSKLSKLVKEEDRQITDTGEVTEALETEIEKICEHQKKIILDALAVRSDSMDDICLKFDIWQSLTFGDKVKPNQLQPGELLIRQTIRELSELLRKAR